MTDGSPPTASDRIAAIRAAMTDDAEAGAAFAEPVRASVEAALERLDAISGSAPHAEAAALLVHVRDRVSGLDPALLEPRRGLAGLFDSRGKRLKVFRVAYASAAEAATSGAADLAERGGAIARRGDDLEALWTELRAGLTHLDDHVAAGRDWLTGRADLSAYPVPPEAAAAFEDTTDAPVEPPVEHDDHSTGPVEAQADAEAHFEGPAVQPDVEPSVDGGDASSASHETEPPAVSALPHPIAGRLETLAALRARAVAALPRIRALQNADHTAPAGLASARERIEAWSADWRDALGLAGRRPRKVHPEAARLIESRDALIDQLTAAERALKAAQTRLAELAPRADAPATDVRAAA